MAFSDTSLSDSSDVDTDDENTCESAKGDAASREDEDVTCQPCLPTDTAEDAEKQDLHDEDLDSLSDVSDNSDLFHVSCKESGSGRTPEDKELIVIESIVPHLREYPLLPPDGRDSTFCKSFTNVESGMRLPLLHCGFRECKWSCDPLIQGHFSLEQCLYGHLRREHSSKEMQMVATEQWDNEREIAEAL